MLYYGRSATATCALTTVMCRVPRRRRTRASLRTRALHETLGLSPGGYERAPMRRTLHVKELPARRSRGSRPGCRRLTATLVQGRLPSPCPWPQESWTPRRSRSNWGFGQRPSETASDFGVFAGPSGSGLCAGLAIQGWEG